MEENRPQENFNINNNNLNNDNINNIQNFPTRITKEEIHSLLSDSLPSLAMILLILIGFGYTNSWCNDNFPIFLKAMIFIYSAFIIKTIFNFFFIYNNTCHQNTQKLSLLTMDLLINFLFYAFIIAGWIIFKNSKENCFKDNPYPTSLIFCILMFGLVDFLRWIFNSLLCLICFPILVYYFIKNPSAFYSKFGIDPEIVMGLPTVKAGPEHLVACAICTHDILIEEEILILKCEGRHHYHAQCIKNWLIQKVNCPICRSERVL